MNLASRLYPAALALTLVLFASFAAAWSEPGHRMIGAIAQTKLNPKAAAEVANLLAAEPEPSLAGVSAWADWVRGNDPEMARTTSNWHYVNFPQAGCAFVPKRDCSRGGCLVAALRKQLALLADRSQSKATRAVALKWVVHLIGDVHQPLHTGYGFDKGGNDFQINWLGEGNNLHWVWDRLLLSTRGIGESQHLAVLKKLPTPKDILKKSTDPALDYALESCQLLRSVPLYPKSRKLKLEYIDEFLPVAERQIILAGNRLARVLNGVLGK
jgi:hypothetical protein